MSQTVITTAFEKLKAQQAATGAAVMLDGFIFANVPGLDITSPIDPAEAIPPAAQIVYRADVAMTGVVNDNAVVYSVTLGATVGDFDFNWVGLINKASNTLAMIVHAPIQHKVANAAGTQGNVLTRSFLMEYDGAKKQTEITTPAATWQIDFTARLTGMDERVRLENVDVYGHGAFLGDGFLVVRSGNSYSAKSGVGYVGGLRNVLAADQALTITTKPVRVWVDTCFTGSLTSVWQVQTALTVADTLADYVKNGIQHYVFAVAQINADGSVTDMRPRGSLSQQQGSNDFLRKASNLADVSDKSVARDSLGLGSSDIPYFTSIELTSSTPFIDFHYSSDTGDFTDRWLAMDDGLHYLASVGRKLTVNAPVAVDKDITASGIIESRASRVTGVQSADKPGMTTDWNPVSGLTVLTNNRGPGAGGFAFRTVDATNKVEIGRVSFTELGDIYAGNAKYANDGNVNGTTWGVNGGSDWLSNFLASKFSGIQTQFNAIPVNNVTGDITGTAWGGLLSAHLAAKWAGLQAQFSAIPVDNPTGNIRGPQWGNDWLSNYINNRFSAIANQLVLSGGQNGYFKDVTTGFLVQFGRLESTTSGPETSGYNIAFPVQCLGVVASVGTEINSGVTVYTTPTNNQGFTYKTSAARTGFTWFAWGK